MKTLKLQMQISVDGDVAGLNGEEDWIVKTEEKLWRLINEIADGSDTLLYCWAEKWRHALCSF